MLSLYYSTFSFHSCPARLPVALPLCLSNCCARRARSPFVMHVMCVHSMRVIAIFLVVATWLISLLARRAWIAHKIHDQPREPKKQNQHGCDRGLCEEEATRGNRLYLPDVLLHDALPSFLPIEPGTLLM